MIYNELTQEQFAHELSNDNSNCFTYKWASILFDYLDNLSEEQSIPFDPVDLRSSYTEWNVENYIREYYTEEYKKYWKEYKLPDCEITRNEFFIDVIKEKDYWYIWGESNLFITYNV